jgi:hypothetical protein
MDNSIKNMWKGKVAESIYSIFTQPASPDGGKYEWANGKISGLYCSTSAHIDNDVERFYVAASSVSS